MKLHTAAAVAALCLLAACSSAKVAQTEVALTAAENAALQYVQLPRCPGPVPGALCSDQAIVAKIAAADNAAYAAVKQAEANTGNSAAQQVAQDAVAALTALVPVKQ